MGKNRKAVSKETDSRYIELKSSLTDIGYALIFEEEENLEYVIATDRLLASTNLPKLIEILKKEQHLTHLSFFNIHSSNIDLITLIHCLVDTNIRSLDISFAKITNEIMQHLAVTLPYTKIDTLKLNWTRITDDILNILLLELPNTKIIVLDLSQSLITDKGKKDLIAVLPHTNIIKIDLGISKLSEPQRRELSVELASHKKFLAEKIEQFMGNESILVPEELEFYSQLNQESLKKYLYGLGLNQKYNPVSLIEKAKNILSLTIKELAEKFSQGPASIVIEYLVNPHLILHSNSFSPETKFDTKSLYYEVAPTGATSSSATVTLTGQIVAGSEVVSSEDTNAEDTQAASCCIIS